MTSGACPVRCTGRPLRGGVGERAERCDSGRRLRSSTTVKKAQVKTQKTRASVADFIAAVEDDVRRSDAKTVDKMLREITGEKPAMWGPTIVGYGTYKNTNSLGEADWPKIGFSPRKANLVVYIMPDLLQSAPLMKKLGKHKIGKTCLYINKLADVDQKVLRELAQRSWDAATEKYG